MSQVLLVSFGPSVPTYMYAVIFDIIANKIVLVAEL